MSLKLRELTESKIWLAPIAGYTDKFFRQICKECGADVMVSEMVSADGLLRNREKTLKYAEFTQDQRPFGIQIFGNTPQIMQKAVEVLIPLKPDFVDINMGCPVKKVTKREAGSALLKDVDKVTAIISAIKTRLLKTRILLSVKLRSGWDRQNINLLELLPSMISAGADLVCIHPRTRSQFYSGNADWSLIKRAKQISDIPVIGNGDIRTCDDAQNLFEQTNCDSIMVGRGALGNPWIFAQIKAKIFKKKIENFTPQKKLSLINKHLDLVIKEKGEKRGLIEMRSHLSFYTKGIKGSAKTRRIITKSENQLTVKKEIENLYKQKNIKLEK